MYINISNFPLCMSVILYDFFPLYFNCLTYKILYVKKIKKDILFQSFTEKNATCCDH